MKSNGLYKKFAKSSLNYEKFIDLAKSVVENEIGEYDGVTVGRNVKKGDDVYVLVEDFAVNMAFGSAYTRNKYLAIGALIGLGLATASILTIQNYYEQKERDEEC